MNLLVLIFLLVMVWKIAEGYKRGMVKEIISFVSLIVLCIMAVLITNGLESYQEKKYISVIVAVLLLCFLGIAHHLLGLVFFSAKMISKLPVVHSLDKVLGIAFGALETVLILWTVYVFVMNMGLGALGQQILDWTRGSNLLSWFYEHNYLAIWLADLIPLAQM